MAEANPTQELLQEGDPVDLADSASIHDCLKSTEPPTAKRSKLAPPVTTQPEKMFVKAFNSDSFSVNNSGAIACSSNGYIIIGTKKQLSFLTLQILQNSFHVQFRIYLR